MALNGNAQLYSWLITALSYLHYKSQLKCRCAENSKPTKTIFLQRGLQDKHENELVDCVHVCWPTCVGHICRSHDASNLLHRLQVWRETCGWHKSKDVPVCKSPHISPTLPVQFNPYQETFTTCYDPFTSHWISKPKTTECLSGSWTVTFMLEITYCGSNGR